MRTIGFIGILLLAIVNAFGLVISLRDGNWKGIGLMLLMVVLLVFFAHTLWRGYRLSRNPSARGRMAPGWAGESVGTFVKNQVARSLEGRILIVSSLTCVAMAAAIAFAPEVLRLSTSSSARVTTLFAGWPILAFVMYVRICGPEFKTTPFTIVAMLVVAGTPFLLAYT
jgi:hypothetical protein